MDHARPWLWPNLLSLDAPIVAVLWQQIFTRTLHIQATMASAVTLASTVWLIYAGDRVLDAWSATGHAARHRFYRRHWRAVTPILAGAVLVAAWCAFTGIRRPILQIGIGLLLVVGVYFCAVHVAPQFTQRWWPKEMAVAVIFSLGTCIHVWTFGAEPAGAGALPLIIFVALCWINCSAIAFWEKADSHPSTVWIGRRMGLLSAAIAAILFVLVFRNSFPEDRLLLAAEGFSALAFMLLDRFSPALSADELRVAADAVLCTPLLFLPFA